VCVCVGVWFCWLCVYVFCVSVCGVYEICVCVWEVCACVCVLCVLVYLCFVCASLCVWSESM